MATENVYVIGAGPAGLAAAVAIGQQHKDVNVLVFDYHSRSYHDAQDAMPVLLHKQGKKALADMDIVVGTVQVDTCLRAEGDIVPAHELFGESPEVLTWRSLVDGLVAKANSLPNVTLQRDGSRVTAIDLENRKMTVSMDDSGPDHSNSHSTYDLPKLLVLAEHCEDVTRQLTEQKAEFNIVSENAAGLALLAIEKVPVEGEGNIQVRAKGDLGLVLVQELGVAVLATVAGRVADLKDVAVVKSLLADVDAPAAVVDAILPQLSDAKSFITWSGSSSHVGIVSQQGDAIVLVGPAAFRTDAPLCLDVNAGLYSAVLMANHVGAKGIEDYNAAFAKEAIDLVRASRPNARPAQVTIANALGLHRSHSRIREKCLGRTPLGQTVRNVAMAPVHLIHGAVVAPVGHLLNLITNRNQQAASTASKE